MQGGEERWIPIFEVENFDDVVEFEKYIGKVDIDSEEFGSQNLSSSSRNRSILLKSSFFNISTNFLWKNPKISDF